MVEARGYRARHSLPSTVSPSCIRSRPLRRFAPTRRHRVGIGVPFAGCFAEGEAFNARELNAGACRSGSSSPVRCRARGKVLRTPGPSAEWDRDDGVEGVGGAAQEVWDLNELPAGRLCVGHVGGGGSRAIRPAIGPPRTTATPQKRIGSWSRGDDPSSTLVVIAS